MERLGERAIIKVLTGIYSKSDKNPLAFEDDVAAIPQKNGKWIILKSDMLVASTDVPRGMSVGQAARKAVVATVSDFAAKGVRPIALLTSLGLPRSLSRKDVRRIGVGLERAAREYQCSIVGGDTSESREFVIDCMGVGEAEPKAVMRRDGAKPGDIVAVTGKFGNSSAGLRILMSRKKTRSRRDRRLLRTVLEPKARLQQGLTLARTGMVTGSIDSSDGLAWSLHELARSSHVGISLDTVPLANEAREFAMEKRLRAADLALYGGEEYELVMTIRKGRFETVKKNVSELIAIGRVVRDTGLVTAIVDGKRTSVEARGYEHFKNASLT